jgi:hypothetical protein
MNGRFIRANQHTTAPQVAQLSHGGFGFLRHPNEALPIVLKHLACVGERPALR